jgi:hypothetical protein
MAFSSHPRSQNGAPDGSSFGLSFLMSFIKEYQ